MKQVSEQEWRLKAQNFQDRIAANPYPVNLDHYRNILSKVSVGAVVADIGCGNCYIKEVLPEGTAYYGFDPFPRLPDVLPYSLEALLNVEVWANTVFVLAALDNVQDLETSLKALKHIAVDNIVILTGIGIPPDQYHTVQIDCKDLTDVLGEPAQEIEISPKVFLFEWKI